MKRKAKLIKSKKPSVKFVYYKESRYLIRLPIFYWFYCSECGVKHLEHYWKGFIKIGEVTKKVKPGWMDSLYKVMMEDFVRNTLVSGTSIQYADKAKTGETVRFRRYTDLTRVTKPVKSGFGS